MCSAESSVMQMQVELCLNSFSTSLPQLCFEQQTSYSVYILVKLVLSITHVLPLPYVRIVLSNVSVCIFAGVVHLSSTVLAVSCLLNHVNHVYN